MKLSNYIALGALVISLLAFVWPVIYEHIKRPCLNIFLRYITFHDQRLKKTVNMVQILVINDGYRPIIISQCKFKFWTGEGGRGHGELGIYDALKYPYGNLEIVLPALIEPAKSLELNFLNAENFKNIQEISLFNSRGKEYKINDRQIQAMKNETKRRLEALKNTEQVTCK